ncbi:MAG: ABC transporter ATP-binding protein [Pseudomonadota bacterium]
MIAGLLKRLLGEEQAVLLYRLIIETAKPYRWRYATAIAFMVVVAAMTGAIPLLMEDFFTEAFIDKSPEALRWLAWLILVIFVVRGTAMYASTVILAQVGNRIVADLQKRLYDHVLAQGMVFHEEHRTGDLSVRITQNCQAARMALQTVATRIGTDLMTVIGLLGVLFYTDLTMSLIALIGAPLIFGGVAALVRRVRNLARAEVTMNARILGAISETVLGARVVKAFNLQPMMRNRAGEAIDGVRERSDQIAVLQSLANPIMEVFAGVAAAAVVTYAGWRIINQGMEIDTFLAFLTALLLLGDPARRLAQTFVVLRQFTAGVEFIYETLDTDRRPAEAASAPDLAVSQGGVAFEDVHFAYGDAAALRGLSFLAEPGQVTALVGPSGAGKSTTLALMERFYDADQGRILVDGQAVTGVALASLRGQMALVTQETFLFDDTIAENIRFGRPEASQTEIEAAAREANAHDFIMANDQGYGSPVGEGGAQLSGGQRQRIAIARAMLRDAPILLLDEATSALDAESEARVQEALHRLMQNRTTIVIAHRLATIARAHKIVVMDQGRSVEEGTHDTLVAKNGLYARLAALQFGARGESA